MKRAGSDLRFTSSTLRGREQDRPDYADEFNLSSTQLNLIKRMFLTVNGGDSLQRTIASAVADNHVEDDEASIYRDDVITYAAAALLTAEQWDCYQRATSTSLFTQPQHATALVMMVQDIRIVLMAGLIRGNVEAVKEIRHIDFFEFVTTPMEAEKVGSVLWEYVESGAEIPFTWWRKLSHSDSSIWRREEQK